MATQTHGEVTKGRAKPGGPAKDGRTSPALFIRQIVSELRKVIWPTRKELITYTGVVMTFVLVMVLIVTALDTAFTKLVFAVLG
jgi:preprotein translocase subunit SecE